MWDLIRPGNACGVTRKEAAALRDLAEALRAAPVGAEGIVRRAIVPIGLRHGYAYTVPIATGKHAPDGTVIWMDEEGTR